MASSASSVNGLEDAVPQWKKELILRKRAQHGKCAPKHQQHQQERQLSSPTASTVTAMEGAEAGRGRDDKQPSLTSLRPTTPVNRPRVENEHVREIESPSLTCSGGGADSVCTISTSPVTPCASTMVAENITNGAFPRAEDSDSSEELQYGPGIVSKLKSKYLSLTLREATVRQRPSILQLRRATSLENLLDTEDLSAPARNGGGGGALRHSAEVTAPRRFAVNGKAPPVNPRYHRPTTRRNDSMKRARSVETLHRATSVPAESSDVVIIEKEGNGQADRKFLDNGRPQRINRPKRITPVMDETERPPADHVRQTKRLFEGPASGRTRTPRPTGQVAAKLAGFRHIIQENQPLAKKPIPPAKPLMNGDRRRHPLRSTSPRVDSRSPSPRISPQILHSPKSSSPDVTPRPSPIPEPGCGRLGETPDLILHSNPITTNGSGIRPHSPATIKNITATFLQTESIGWPKTHDETDSPIKEVSKQAIENISRAGNTVTFNINDTSNKSHLPKLNPIPVRINKLVPEPLATVRVQSPRTAPPPPPAPQIITSPEVNGVAESRKKANAPKPGPTKPLAGVVNPVMSRDLDQKLTAREEKSAEKILPPTNRELEKNLINRAKTLEQPVSRVVVSVMSVEDVVVKPLSVRKTSRGPEQNTFKFDFKDRETVPDYIPHDDVVIRRGKREKPKAGDSGYKIMPGAPMDQFIDEDELCKQELNRPPSPCDVIFENDNVLIDGKSSIKQSKGKKMRIQFDDEATQTFLYPSEASMMEEPSSATSPSQQVMSTTTGTTVNTGSTPGHAVPSLSGSSLASYTPSKMSMTAGFQLGVTRSTQPPIVTPPTATATTAAEPSESAHEPLVPVTYSAETNSDILF